MSNCVLKRKKNPAIVRGDFSKKRPNSNPVCGAVVGVQLEGSSNEGEVEVSRVGAVEGASRSVLEMACEMDGNYFKVTHSENTSVS